MPDRTNSRTGHFILPEDFTTTGGYVRPQQRRKNASVPERDRQSHGNALLAQVEALKPESANARTAQEEAGLEEGFGLRVEFESFPDIQLAFESLARERSGIELLNVRHDREKNQTFATIFVPDGKLVHFEKVIRDYLQDKKGTKGQSLDHKNLINTISSIRAAGLRALWTDDPAVFPDDADEVFWWEVWLPIRGDRLTTVATFRKLALTQSLYVAPEELRFPERTVVLVRASAADFRRSMMTLNSIAELRRAKETAEFFEALPPEEQPDWLDELIGRSTFVDRDEQAPYVCLLDTGINNGHPLIGPALASEDLHTVEPAWGSDDRHGHGTNMAGLALAGDLTHALDSMEPLRIGHRLESVKLVPHDGANVGDARHHGYLTVEAVSRPEISDPYRRRVFGLTVTARDNRDRGRPSAWSAALDRLAADAEEGGNSPRLLVVAAGNITDPNAWSAYPHSNATDGIHDPAQAWNALTVGACTDLCRITEPDTDAFQSIAAAGGLSPFSTTSRTWEPHWPFKPDVVFEGGNAAKDKIGAISMHSLSLLTTHHLPEQRLFTTAAATSAATALAARMAARIMSAYPALRPESIRGLIVHSANWTEEMERMFLPQTKKPNKADYAHLVRHCGFGVPDLQRALFSVSNSLTMISEARLFPFARKGSNQPTLGEMNMHELPWPKTELEALGPTIIEMRVTLSYFIEPNPSERGVRSRYRYESHGLRFDVKRSAESEPAFRARINAAARDEEEEEAGTGGSDEDWRIGIKHRHKGSLHSDIWRGTAADLASRGVLAVYPTAGWWKTRTKLERYDSPARYTLIVSIHAPEVETDLYSAVANRIAVSVKTP